jgi:hypothetical protein
MAYSYIHVYSEALPSIYCTRYGWAERQRGFPKHAGRSSGVSSGHTGPAVIFVLVRLGAVLVSVVETVVCGRDSDGGGD